MKFSELSTAASCKAHARTHLYHFTAWCFCVLSSLVVKAVYYQSRNTQKSCVAKLQACEAEIGRVLIPLTIECIHFKAVCLTQTTKTGMILTELYFNQPCDSKTHSCLRTRSKTKHFKAPLFFFFFSFPLWKLIQLKIWFTNTNLFCNLLRLKESLCSFLRTSQTPKYNY